MVFGFGFEMGGGEGAVDLGYPAASRLNDLQASVAASLRHPIIVLTSTP